MDRKIKLILLIGLPIIGIAAGYFLMGRSVQINVDGKTSEILTHALTIRGALLAAGYSVEPEDRVSPPANSWLSRTTRIDLDRSRLVRIWIDPDGRVIELTTAALTPVEILRSTGIEPAADDAVQVNGSIIPLDEEITNRGELTLQYCPAISFQVNLDGDMINIRSTQPNLGLALLNEGIRLRVGDSVSIPLNEAPKENVEVAIDSARPIEVTADGITLTTFSAKDTIVEVLQSVGVVLQDLDYAIPGERNPVPEDGRIKVVRVTEELILEQTTIPYDVQYIADDSLEVNQRQVVEEGQVGIKASRVRVRYEDGVEVSRTVGEEILISNPVTRLIHYGSRVTDKVMDTPDGPITYYLATNVTATSYSPCRSGVPGKCYDKAFNGMTVQKGVIGVNRAWYDIFGGTLIYVPGYGVGTIADVGAFPGTNNWIDLGYSDADFVSWGAVNLTIYFLSPPPTGFTGVLP